MQENNLKEAIITIESALSFVKDQLSSAEASIRYAQLELDSLTQIIQNLSMQKDMHVCKCKESPSTEVIFLCGEKIDEDDQQNQDLAKIVNDFWLNSE